ncbi:hypothetical protein RDI58_001994 [Solanum bulbocastanum]|uniref:Uncharacterized protein n=1 Tax=Solanum bulbocastanum TaxID=147425 RepID=A0AAN8YQF7_SOLBU
MVASSMICQFDLRVAS